MFPFERMEDGQIGRVKFWKNVLATMKTTPRNGRVYIFLK
jgi:hypothetical protein